MATRARGAATAGAKRPPPKTASLPKRAPRPPRPIVLDSSCWLEHFAGSARADRFDAAVAAPGRLVVPLLTLYEVVKVLTRTSGDETAARALSLMQQGRVVGLDLQTVLQATRNGLPLADSLVYATAQAHGAELWTQDAHFDGLPGVRYLAKD